MQLGKWFVSDEHGISCPDFVSSHNYSVPTNDDIPYSTNGWRPRKQDYPDLWIDPDDSVVLSLNAGEIIPTTAFPSRITLRFPRITQLRPEKKAREVETIESLWDIHEQVLNDRATDTSENAFNLGSGTFSNVDAVKDRFWTEEKFLSQGKGRKKPRKRTFHSVATSGPVVVESPAFRGLTVVCLEGRYRLRADSLEAAEGKEEGWLEEAKRIKDHDSFRAFIKRHGGTTMLQPAAKLVEEGALIVGGNKNDPRVINFIGMIEGAIAQVPQLSMKKKPTDKDKDLLSFAKCRGVVRWTFLFSALSKWRASSKGGNKQDDSVNTADSELLVPDSFEYLARPKGQSGNVLEDLSRIDVCDLTKMRRLLHEVSESTEDDENKECHEPSGDTWQTVCKASLDPKERWITRCSHQILWPYQEDAVIVQETYIYPHVFDNPRDTKNQLINVDPYEHSGVMSVLPLLRVSGASVSPQLSLRVTHVLCNLRDDLRRIPSARATPKDFVDPEDGKRIIEEVKKSPLYPDECPDFVSPAWARSDVWDWAADIGEK